MKGVRPTSCPLLLQRLLLVGTITLLPHEEKVYGYASDVVKLPPISSYLQRLFPDEESFRSLKIPQQDVVAPKVLEENESSGNNKGKKKGPSKKKVTKKSARKGATSSSSISPSIKKEQPVPLSEDEAAIRQDEALNTTLSRTLVGRAFLAATNFLMGLVDLEDFTTQARNMTAKTIWVSVISRAQLCLVNNFVSWLALGPMVGYPGEEPLVLFLFNLDRVAHAYCNRMRKWLSNHQKRSVVHQQHRNMFELKCVKPWKADEEGEKVTHLGSKFFNRLNWVRPALAYLASFLDLNVVVSDVDIVHMRWPFLESSSKTKSKQRFEEHVVVPFRISRYLESQLRVQLPEMTDPWERSHYANAGFFYAEVAEKRVLAAWLGTLSDKYYDQHGFNGMLAHTYERDHQIHDTISYFDPMRVCACRDACFNETKTKEGTSNNTLPATFPWASMHYSCDEREPFKIQDMTADNLWRPRINVSHPEVEKCGYSGRAIGPLGME
ncbi:unnamed protein product [Amoebophrya sp. A25]|nr:unnamed protein product [Amoebophrya sp. A25]|eukprot:GSA25T00001359001.1